MLAALALALSLTAQPVQAPTVAQDTVKPAVFMIHRNVFSILEQLPLPSTWMGCITGKAVSAAQDTIYIDDMVPALRTPQGVLCPQSHRFGYIRSIRPAETCAFDKAEYDSFVRSGAEVLILVCKDKLEAITKFAQVPVKRATL